MKSKQHIGAEPPPWDGFQEFRFLKMFRFIWYHSRVFKLLLNNESLNPTARDGLPPYKWLVRDAPEASKTMLAVADALSCPPELDSKSLLQKAPYTLTTAHRKKKIKLERNWMHPLCLPDSIVPEGSLQSAGGEQSYSAVDLASGTTNARQGITSGAAEVCLLG